MKKSDLKVGQKILIRDGGEYLYIPITTDDFCEIDDSTIDTCSNIQLDYYNEDLMDKDDDDEYDIMAIYECIDKTSSYLLSDLSKVNWTEIWKREQEFEEISAQEAMNRLEALSGKKVKIVNR